MKNTEFDSADLQPKSTKSLSASDTPVSAAQPQDTFGEAANAKVRTNVLENIVSRETILDGTSVCKMYRLFRHDGLNRTESLYNAVYLSCHNRYNRTPSALRSKYKNIYEHPRGWSEDKLKLHKHNIWSCALKVLDGFAGLHRQLEKVAKATGAFFRKIAHIPHSMDNSLRAIKAFFRILCKSALPLTAIVLTVYTATCIAAHSTRRFAVGVYVDGAYVGNTRSVAAVLDAKHQYETDLTNRYGSPVVLECDLVFLPCEYDESSLIQTGDTSIFNAYMEDFTEQGFGLYIDGRLAAVTSVEKWFDDAIEDCISLQRQKYLAAYDVTDDEIDRFIYNNNLSIIADRYPESYFLTRSQVRKLFSLPELSDSDAKLFEENLHFIKWQDFDRSLPGTFSYTLNLDYASLDGDTRSATSALSVNAAVPTETVSMDFAFVKEESERVTVPYQEEYIYDEEMPEGMRRLVRNGKDGEKILYYKSTYQSGKLVKQELSGEEILTEAVSKIVRVGTKTLTEEERALIPTGTYIYPYQGTITSTFGWRVLNGQNNFHQGLDIYGSRGDTIVAADGGEVIEVGYTYGYGNYCKIRHNEDIVTRYAHCDAINVQVGDFVGQGFPIATLGDTGNATGVHVHFEIIKNGVTVDPLPYMNGNLPYAN
ncbi:MAG: peptidoglycan DD-metalloendopeptidase family protein [Eubacteriales bacterium]